MTVSILVGDCRDRLRELPAASFETCVTSPPFWRQRDYGMAAQIGVEREPSTFAAAMVDVFREIRRVLTPDGSLWIELGDTYAAGGNGGGGSRSQKRKKLESLQKRTGWRSAPPGYKERDLSLSPFLVADALRADGWYLRQVIIWDKRTATEPPRLDRPSVAHSYVFLLSPNGPSRVRDPGEDWFCSTVWSCSPSSLPDHPAPMSAEVVRRCIVSGTAAGERVLDPFGGAGTTGLVADQLGRDATLIELNPDYAEMARRRIGLFANVIGEERETAREPKRTAA